MICNFGRTKCHVGVRGQHGRGRACVCVYAGACAGAGVRTRGRVLIREFPVFQGLASLAAKYQYQGVSSL